ncbi:Nitrilase/cyanide hydratase and apolipoprotein N-acyltransferase [Cordyceps fumosorosea ARSEF 2679]|uniref:Nitrilase/cyanide hydratase and apolipoprotein N-acyltransferase n=1 Tax=Cordyceps fumosorosea (strain ARSEF 2679) TaxID=1081104 RepID=A0A167LPD6_CORFA|nr:Nitrilase/cyanide hydratase and apolipoprotein N-acyltransferase [Cordyceps fumosorosea ARSEF 2679]OAA53332.1 Nitrilase/cyanide hydratase and apolipoprotein N-acyltransferase [Cordyceps fumosorosea ARSEF 2679]
MAFPRITDLRIASVQFESISGDKPANLATITRLAATASAAGCHVVAFHECCIPGYTFAARLSRAELAAVAEPVPTGPSVQALVAAAKAHGIIILAGLYERDEATDELFNTYVCVSGDGLLARFRKLHPFISEHLAAGSEIVVFHLLGWRAGVLICYDNNVIENVRATALRGAEILFAPHVTMCTPSTRPGAGFVDPALWHRRAEDPTTLRAEFDGLKGRAWLMKWLPARAYDNAIYVVFSNPIGMDDDQLKNGCSMVLDPFGDVIAECRKLDEDMAVAVCTREKLHLAGGFRYRQARRPQIYGEILAQDNNSQLKIAWM